MLVGISWGFGFAPIDSKQGDSYRIIFIHMPAAALALVGYYIMAIAGAVGLIWRMKLPFMVMKSAAPIGAALTVLTLATGSRSEERRVGKEVWSRGWRER